MKKKLAEFLFGASAKKNYVMVWGNQKGGAGKSTLCTLFANMWVKTTGRDLVVVDCDPQHTLYQLHKKEVEENPDMTPLYNVYPFGDIDNIKKTVDMIDDARRQNCDILFDSPGNLSNEGIAALLMKSDIILCPTAYDLKTLTSTVDFNKFNIAKARELHMSKPPQTFFFINRYNKSWGTKKELEARKAYDKYLSSHGTLAARIPSCADLQRTSTFYITPKQEAAVAPAFTPVINQILGK